jgi:pentose-5-phosphate-3-epimerase
MQLIPAILAPDYKQFNQQWDKVSPLSKTIQIDIMDGVFVTQKNNIKPDCLKILTKNH